MNLFVCLAFEFFKTGLFAVGGGLATLPFLYDIIGRYGWVDSSVVSDMIAISESTPGPIGVNMATYLGFSSGFATSGLGYGIIAGIVATLSLVLPSLIVIIIVAKMLDKFRNSTLVDSAFVGLRPAVCGLIGAAALQVFISSCLDFEAYKETGTLAELFDIKALCLFVLLFVFHKKFKPHPIFIIIPAAIIGIIFKM